MCEANVFMAAGDGAEELIMEAVDRMTPEGPDAWRLVSIFGEQKVVNGHIKYMKLVDHRIIFEP